MFSLGMFFPRFLWIFFVFASFWPWERDPGQVKKSSLGLPRDPVLLKTLRVALFYEKSEVQISVPGSYEMKKFPASEPLSEGPSLPLTRVRPDPSGIRVGPALYPVSGLRLTSAGKEVEIENKKYRNAIQILKNPNGSLTVVNEIDVEDYLKGVLPWESNPEWTEEALEAQAIVSRTYAIFKNIENKDFPFTLSADAESQVYAGKAIERASTNRAVERTRGLILVYRGKIFPAFFHSTCGGRTTRAEDQWRIEAHPSLKSVDCPFCQGSKYYYWKAEFSPSEIETRLAKKGFRVSGIQTLSPDSLDVSGRAHFFVVQYAGGSLKIPAGEFRSALGRDRMRSTHVQIDRQGDRFFFKGRGWGHGVGMCQMGAKHLAELGYHYPEILRYYYPGSEIRNLEDFLGEGVPSEAPGRGSVFKRWYGKLKSYVEDL